MSLISQIKLSHLTLCYSSSFFFFNDTATTEIYTLSLHDALPISHPRRCDACRGRSRAGRMHLHVNARRSEEHTSELQSHSDLVCRLLLEKKKKTDRYVSASSTLPFALAQHASSILL